MTTSFSTTQNKKDILVTFLEEYNIGNAEPYNETPFEFIVEENDQIIGGLSGYIGWRWMNIEILAVHPKYRNNGHGRTLLDKAIKYAQKKNCIGIRLSTVDFQAPEFYKKFGFEIYGILKNHPQNHKTFAMQRILIK